MRLRIRHGGNTTRALKRGWGLLGGAGRATGYTLQLKAYLSKFALGVAPVAH